MRYGFHGRVLHVDLSARQAWVEEQGDTWWRVYGGGGLLAAWYLMRECEPGVDALAAGNLLIFSSSVVAGQAYAGLARFTVAGKSPLTGGIGETRCEGAFATALKGSGADAIVFHGAAESPTVVVVEGGQVRFEEAGRSWGMETGAATDALCDRFGSDIHTAVIGPAGENLVRFASVVADRTHQAARMGMGAVMGSKKLKALVIKGASMPEVHDAGRCEEITGEYLAEVRVNSLTKWQFDPPGFAAWVHLHGVDTALCTRNYTASHFDGAGELSGEKFMAEYKGVSACPGCPNDCIKKFSDDSAGGIHQEITGTLGPNLGIADLGAILQANVQCNQLGLDPVSLGFTLSMAMECCLPHGPRFGEAGALAEWIENVAYRRGLGDILAEGVKRAAEKIGGDAPKAAMHVKGLEMVCFEPRTQTNLALGYAVAPIGPRYDICEHDWDYDTETGWEHTLDRSRTLGILERIPMNEQSVRKVRNFKSLLTLWSAADALDLCIFAVAPVRILSLEKMAALVSAVTGWETSSYELMRFGERRLHLMRLYNLREGLTSLDDTLPDRFFNEGVKLEGGRFAGARLDRAAFEEAKVTFYRMMGWDDEGRPRFETLLDHHLEWASAPR